MNGGGGNIEGGLTTGNPLMLGMLEETRSQNILTLFEFCVHQWIHCKGEHPIHFLKNLHLCLPDSINYGWTKSTVFTDPEQTGMCWMQKVGSARKEPLLKPGTNASTIRHPRFLKKFMKSWLKDLYFTTRSSRLLQHYFVATNQTFVDCIGAKNHKFLSEMSGLLLQVGLVTDKSSPTVSKRLQSLSDR